MTNRSLSKLTIPSIFLLVFLFSLCETSYAQIRVLKREQPLPSSAADVHPESALSVESVQTNAKPPDPIQCNALVYKDHMTVHWEWKGVWGVDADRIEILLRNLSTQKKTSKVYTTPIVGVNVRSLTPNTMYNVAAEYYSSKNPSARGGFVLKLKTLDGDAIQMDAGEIGNRTIPLPDYGSVFQTYMNVDAKANKFDCTGTYQCPELVKRFVNSALGITPAVSTTGHGYIVAYNLAGKTGTANYTKNDINTQSNIRLYYYGDGDGEQDGLKVEPKGKTSGSSEQAPVCGSVLSFTKTSENSDYGHTAIVKKTVVGKNNPHRMTVYLFEQNFIGGGTIAHSRSVTFTRVNGRWQSPGVIGWTVPIHTQ